MSFLAIDVGNTRLKWALYSHAHPHATVLAQGVEFLDHIDRLAEGPWTGLPQPSSMLGCIVSSDAVRHRIQAQLDLWDVEPRWVVANNAEAGLSNGYVHPSRLGPDRWVAMVGAWHRMKAQEADRPIVLAMIGTAVTVEAIDLQGHFLGGYILPGHGIMLRALENGTAGLHVPTGDVCPFPTNTSDALTSGGTFAIAGAIERMVRHVESHCRRSPYCVMTGGAGWKVLPAMETPFELQENLIFEGLLQIAAHREARRG